MVLLQFPSSLTEEELMLKAKYGKLKRTKKKLAALKANQGQRSKEEADGIMKASQSNKKKTLPDAKDAKEVARKLIR